MKLNHTLGRALVSAMVCCTAAAPVLAQDGMAHAGSSGAMQQDSMKKNDGMMKQDSMKSGETMKSKPSMKHMKMGGMKGHGMANGDAMKGDTMKSDGK